MKNILVSLVLFFIISLNGYSQHFRYNQPISDTNLIIFADTINYFVTDSFEHNVGIVPQNHAQLTKYFKYIGKDNIHIEKSWTGDPHYICGYDKDEKLISGKIYSFEVCFSQISRPGRFYKKMGFRMSNDSIVTFLFTGTVISEYEEDYQYFGEFYKGFAPAQYQGNWIIVDRTFQKIIDIPYDCLTEMIYPDTIMRVVGFSEDLMPIINKNDKIGFVNRLGKIVIPCLFTSVDRFSEGLCFVSKSENLEDCFVINNIGETVIKGPFEAFVGKFIDGKANVIIDGYVVEIDRNGAIIKYLYNHPYISE
ncbi:MAG: WG repeat-containing protein [Bacteroidales bacterium]|nr:WG repeat-containing protein [Bacteroidales bacterium]